MNYSEKGEEEPEKFYKRIKERLDKQSSLGGNGFVTDLKEFKKDYPSIYEEVFDELIGHAAQLARQAQMTISLLLSNFQMNLCLDDVTKTIQIASVHNKVNKFTMNVNVNYWLDLGPINKNFEKKSSVFKERVTSFYLLHLLLSKDKTPETWSLSSELETTQFLTNEDLLELDPWDLNDIKRLLNLELPSDGTAAIYYDLINDDLDKKLSNDSEKDTKSALEFIEELKSSKHDERFVPAINSNMDEVDMMANISDIITQVKDVISGSESFKDNDKSWGAYSEKIHSVLKALKPKKPRADYKSMLRRVVGRVKGGKKRSFKKLNKRKDWMAKGKVRYKNDPHVLVAIDVSASVRDDEIMTALGEVCHIKRGLITVLQFDWENVSKHTYTSKSWDRMLIDGFELNGRGGTNFSIPVKEFQNNLFSNQNKNGYSFMIVFTDGEALAKLPLLENGETNTKAKSKIRWMLTESGNPRDLLRKYPSESIIYLHETTFKKYNQ
jgi:predicted metal-dependent peptidase